MEPAPPPRASRFQHPDRRIRVSFEFFPPKTDEMEKALWDEGVYALGILYPTVARGKARIRTMPSAAHTQEDLEVALAAFKRVRDRLS